MHGITFTAQALSLYFQISSLLPQSKHTFLVTVVQAQIEVVVFTRAASSTLSKDKAHK